MDARIRYLAVVSEKPAELATFYAKHFSMRELGRSDEGDVALTDGFYNVSFLKPRAGLSEPGIRHLGVEIDDIRELEGRLEEFAPKSDIRPEAGDLFHGEYQVFDPNGLTVSVSTRHFNVPALERGLPAIRHVALSCEKRPEILDFYANVFGFREAPTPEGRQRRFWAMDGETALAILPYPVDQDIDTPPPGGWTSRHFKDGVNHFGFLLPDLDHFLTTVPKETVSKRPDIRPATEWRLVDPEENEIDLSQSKGYEIDLGTVARG